MGENLQGSSNLQMLKCSIFKQNESDVGDDILMVSDFLL